jgi:predicted secreted protein
MSLNSRQLIIAGGAGVATAIAIASIAIQSQSPQPTPNGNPVEAPTASADPRPKASPIVVMPSIPDCEIKMAVVADPEPPLNVRSSPEVKEGNIVGQLNNNTFVSVADEQMGWLRITSPVAGWVAKNRTESSCAIVNKKVTFFPGGNEAIVRGKIIGGGSHSYKIDATQGQTLAIENYKDIFPVIITPDGQLLSNSPTPGAEVKQWKGELPITGEYTLQLESNLRGFEYEFLIIIE